MFNDTDNGQTQYCKECFEKQKQIDELLKFCDYWENSYNKVKAENDLLKIKIGELSIQ